MTLKLYGRARSRADRNLWLLFELNAPFEQVEVIQPAYVTSPDQVSSRSASYMKINPNGRVPVLEDDGVVIWESLAINLYLARKFGGPLAPNGLIEEGHTAMWSLWAANECEQLGAQVVVHRVNKPPAEREPAKADAAIAQLRAPFGVLDGALAGKSYLVGDRFTVADINVAIVLNYLRCAPELFADAPNVSRWFTALTGRPAYKKVMEMREACVAFDKTRM